MPPIRLPAARARVFRRLLNAIYNQFPPGLERHLVFQYVLEYLSRASFAHFWIAFVFFINRQLYFPVYPSQEDCRRMNPSLSRLGGYFARRTGDPPLPILGQSALTRSRSRFSHIITKLFARGLCF